MIAEVTRPVKPLVKVHADLTLAKDTLRTAQRDLRLALLERDNAWAARCREDVRTLEAAVDELSAEEDRVFAAQIAAHDFRGLEVVR